VYSIEQVIVGWAEAKSMDFFQIRNLACTRGIGSNLPEKKRKKVAHHTYQLIWTAITS